MIGLLLALGLTVAAPAQAAAGATAPAAPGASVQTSSTQAAPAPTAPDASGQAASDYRLGAGDRVAITVFDEDELSKEYQVAPSGTISMPLIGDVQAVGRTGAEVRDEVQRRLAAGFLNHPQATVAITSFRPFYILGEISKPGEYPYKSDLTVTAAVATAQGFTYRAQKRYVFIKREGEAQETRVPLTPDLKVHPGDTIRFGERYF